MRSIIKALISSPATRPDLFGGGERDGRIRSCYLHPRLSSAVLVVSIYCSEMTGKRQRGCPFIFYPP